MARCLKIVRFLFLCEKVGYKTPLHNLQGSQSTGFVRSLKTLEFLEFDFKALKVLAIGVWSLKVLDFLLNKIRKYQHL